MMKKLYKLTIMVFLTVVLLTGCGENNFTVTFKDYNGNVIKIENVEEGKSAIAPELLEREGYTFIEWDKDYNNVTSDLDIKAFYEINQYTITFNRMEEIIFLQLPKTITHQFLNQAIQ